MALVVAGILFFLAPVIAYIMTIIVRILFQIICYLIKGLIKNKFWIREAYKWWKYNILYRFEVTFILS